MTQATASASNGAQSLSVEALCSRILAKEGYELEPILRTLCKAYDPELVQYQLMLAQGAAKGTGAVNPFAAAVPLNLLPEPLPIERLWKFALYPGTIALFIAESGAGKSTLLLNILLHAALQRPAFGVDFEVDRPLRTLYIDPENFGRTVIQRLERIGLGRPSDIAILPGYDVDLSRKEQIAALEQVIVEQQYDIVVLDPIANLFNTVNENDNSEAARQMAQLTGLVKRTGVCCIAVHHTDKTGASSAGRGAYARLAAADVAFMLRARGMTDADDTDDSFNGALIPREDLVRLQCVKNRLEGKGSLYLQMAGDDRFLPSSFPAWKDANAKGDPDVSRVEAAREDIIAVLADGYWRTRPELFALLAHEGYGQAITNSAISILKDEGIIVSQKISNVARYNLAQYLHSGGYPVEAPPMEFGGDDNDF